MEIIEKTVCIRHAGSLEYHTEKKVSIPVNCTWRLDAAEYNKMLVKKIKNREKKVKKKCCYLTQSHGRHPTLELGAKLVLRKST